MSLRVVGAGTSHRLYTRITDARSFSQVPRDSPPAKTWFSRTVERRILSLFIKLVLIEAQGRFWRARPMPAPALWECAPTRQPIPYAETSLRAMRMGGSTRPYWYRHHRLRAPAWLMTWRVVLISEIEHGLSGLDGSARIRSVQSAGSVFRNDERSAAVGSSRLDILFEDNHCLAVAKAGGGAQRAPLRGARQTLDRAVKAYLKEEPTRSPAMSLPRRGPSAGHGRYRECCCSARHQQGGERAPRQAVP